MDKQCFKCGAVRDLRDFYKHPRMADGHLNKCKDCTRRDTVLRYREKRQDPSWLAGERKRQVVKQTKKRKEYRARHPERWRARVAVHNAVKRGKLVKPTTCSHCGKQCRPDAHHRDYARPLDVVWLCRACHVRADGRASPF